jgi:ethanolamine kinase
MSLLVCHVLFLFISFLNSQCDIPFFAGLEDCDYSRYPNRDYQMSWLKHYLKCWNKAHSVDGNGHGNLQVSQHQVESLYVIVNKFTLASHLFWILWTLIQAEHSEIDFDFLK